MILSTTGDVGRARRPLRRDRRARATLPVVAVLLGSSAAAAQPEQHDRAGAEALFREAREFLKKGQWEAACPKFEASFALEPSASTLLNIARCHEHDGKIATAWQDYNRAITLNRETPGKERQKDLEKIANQGISALEPRLPRLRVVIASLPEGIKVQRDGALLPVATLGSALPIDPGPHEVTASAPRYRTETRSVVLEESKTATIEISLQLIPVKVAPPRPPKLSERSLLPAGIAFGVGALGLGIGAVTGALSLVKVSNIKQRCTTSGDCLVSDKAERDSAATLGDASTVSSIVGGVGVAAGAALLLLRRHGGDKKPDPPASSGRSKPWTGWSAGFGLGRVELQGRF